MSYPPQQPQDPYGSPNPYDQAGSSSYGNQPEYSSPTPPDYSSPTPPDYSSPTPPDYSSPTPPDYSTPSPVDPAAAQPPYSSPPAPSYGDQPFAAPSGDPYAAPQYPTGQQYGDQSYGFGAGQQYPATPGGQPYQPATGGQPYPGAGLGAPQPQRKSTGLIVGIVVGVLALLCTGAGVAVVASGALDGVPKASASASHGGTADPKESASSAPSPTPTGKQVKLAAPEQIGSLKKSADQSTAQEQSKRLVDAGYEDPFAAQYQETSNRMVLMWGGTGKAFGSTKDQARLDEFFQGASTDLNGATLGARVPGSPGTAGGSVECAPLTGLGVTATICGWVGQNALLAILLRNYDVTKSGPQVTAILSAVVTKE